MNRENLEKDPMWFKNAVIYQLLIKGYLDSNDDGIGDFPGLTQKLDYLKSLGITAVWLLPFYPSPQKDDGYDISDYFDVNPIYGTLKDFRHFLKEAHRRGIRVIIELVINHTSDQHPWFQRARNSKPGSAWRNYYVWSDTPEKYKDARIIFKDFETSNWTWDPVAKAYFWHRFYSHQPDLNFENPLVKREIFRALDFWFDMGVDGLRLDAIPYLFEQEGTHCENLPQTHQFLKELRKHVDENFEDRILIAEANQWPEDAAAYFGKGDECHMAFHFPVMPRLFMAIRMEDKFPIVDILEQTPTLCETCQWALFLRNHDELTLEMVSDEERDYMYRIYARDPHARINLGIRRRLAPLLDNDRAKIELINILLFSLPGATVIYYGDEIGMGDNYYLGDRNGVRTPMQWNVDRNAGFSKANPQQLYLPLIIDPPYHYEVVNVENQERNPSSFLWWVRRVLTIYKNHKVFGSGTLQFISTGNPTILAFLRLFKEEIILVAVNLSRFPQAGSLELSQYAGYIPRELFHQNKFPTIKSEPYNLTFGGYNYYWLSLTPSEASVQAEEVTKKTYVVNRWEELFEGKQKRSLETELFAKYIVNARWFEHKSYTIRSTQLAVHLPLGNAQFCILDVEYLDLEIRDSYALILSYALSAEAEQIRTHYPESIIANIKIGDQDGVLYGSIYSESFRRYLLDFISKRRKIKYDHHELVAFVGNNKKTTLREFPEIKSSNVLKTEQSNSSIAYDQHLILKLFRRLEEGINPDIEVKQFLTEKTQFANIPKFAGAIEWRAQNSQPISIALLEQFIPNEGTGWQYTVNALTSFYEHILTLKNREEELAKIKDKSSEESSAILGTFVEEIIGGGYLESTRVLGQRTAELHIALASQLNDLAFCPEPFSILYQRSLYQSIRKSVRTVIQQLKKKVNTIPENMKSLVTEVIKSEQDILSFYQKILIKKMDCSRIRIHGDYHLGQVLYTGKDFYIIDFEGEPIKSISSRRLKRSPLQDVAGMIRSFQYASVKALMSSSVIRPELIPQLIPWADLWFLKISSIFIKSYLSHIHQSFIPLVPNHREDFDYLLQCFIIEKAAYEIEYELNMRPDWLDIPCKGLLSTLKNKISL